MLKFREGKGAQKGTGKGRGVQKGTGKSRRATVNLQI